MQEKIVGKGMKQKKKKENDGNSWQAEIAAGHRVLGLCCSYVL